MKQAYTLECQDCHYVKQLNTENYYNFGDSYPDDCCFKKICPKCKSSKFDRAPHLEEKGKAPAGIAKPGADGRARNMKKQVQEDLSRVRKGDFNFIQNLAGDKPNSLRGSGVKYMKDTKRRGIKRTG